MKSLRTSTVSGSDGCAGPAGRSLVMLTIANGMVLLSQPSGRLGPATPKMPANVCSRIDVSLSVFSKFK